MSATAIHCCPSCKRTFKAHSRLIRHTARAPNCKWVHDRRILDGHVEMKDYREFSEHEDDHLGNQDVTMVEMDEFARESRRTESPLTQNSRAVLACEDSHNSCEDSVLTVEAYPEAGRVLRYDTTTHATYSRTCPDPEMEGNRYHPFLNKGDYEVARWAVEQEPGQNTLTSLLSIDEVSTSQR